MKDSQWLASLARCGLLRPSFIPPQDLRELRLVTRYRLKLTHTLASEKNRLHKVLDDAGIRLGGLVSDINGTSAQAMIAGLIAGRPLTELIGCARGRMQAKREPLRQALDEPLSERHRVVLQELHHHIDFLEHQLRSFNQRILAAMAPYQHQWRLLQTLPGVDTVAAALLIAEIGIDMERFGSGEQFASWAGLCPGHNESAGKRKSSRLCVKVTEYSGRCSVKSLTRPVEPTVSSKASIGRWSFGGDISAPSWPWLTSYCGSSTPYLNTSSLIAIRGSITKP